MGSETKSPTANSGSWFNPIDAYSSDDQYAFCTAADNSHLYYDYGFSLAGKTIDKVEIGIEFYCRAIESLRVRVSWDGGNTWSGWSNRYTLTTEDIIWLNFTSGTDWTPEKLSNDNLKVEVQLKVGGGGGCFAPDTLIAMADGSQKYIKDVELGEKVLSRDGIAVVTAKTVHKSVEDKYLLVKFKNVVMVPTHLVWEDSEWHAVPSGLKIVKMKEVVNIETDKQSLYANKILVHNIEKGAWTAYLDWIPVRVTYSSEAPKHLTDRFVLKGESQAGKAKGYI